MDLQKAHLGSFYLALLNTYDFCLTWSTNVSAASAVTMGDNDNSADNPFILPSTLTTFQPFLLAADLNVKLHVDGRRLRADLRASGAHDRHRLGFLFGPECA